MNHQVAPIIILLWIFVEQMASADTEPCPKYCLCNKSKATMDCDGKHGVLKFIPKAPNYVNSFQLTNTNMGQMTKRKFANLTYFKLAKLQLLYNNITNISPDALSEFKYLQKLIWKQNYFPMVDFGSAIQHIQSRIAVLIIQADKIDTKTVWASNFTKNFNLRRLSLSLKEMKTFNTTGLVDMKKLEYLDLIDNRLEDFSVNNVVPNLRALQISKNDLVDIPILCYDINTPLTPKLSYLNIEDNAIRVLVTSDISCLKNLRKLSLNQNKIELLQNNVFACLPALRYLKLSQQTSNLSFEHLAFNSSSLAGLDLLFNWRLTTGQFNPKTLFTHSPKLTELDISNTRLELRAVELTDLLLTLKNIEHLRLQKTSIKILPVGVFSHLTKLTTLILSGNHIGKWDKDVFANVTSIKNLFLDGNIITTINESSFPLEFRLSVKKIDLADNPFSCTCDLLWFRTWMNETIANKSITFPQYPQHYRCRTPFVGRLAAYNPTSESCSIAQLYFRYLVIALSACVVFTVAGLVTYRYRWYILYWISLMRRRRQRQVPPKEIQYDGFVSYSNPDWDWVSSELLDFLEGQVGMRMCEHSRDFKAGMYIVDNVIEAMETSRKTILVISNEYMKSDWCQFELNMALSSFLDKDIDIVVILLEHIKAINVTTTLRALMVSTTYIEWSDDEEAKRLFRDRIQNAMRE